MEKKKLDTALQFIIKNQPSIEEYNSFLKYCILKDKGLRKQAMNEVDNFIFIATSWDFEIKKSFIIWLFSIFEDTVEYYHVLIHPLENKFILPFLQYWIEIEPNNSRPYRWLGLFCNVQDRLSILEKAVEKGGDNEQRAITQIISLLVDSLWYSTHHLSEGLYLGRKETDFETIKLARYYACKVFNSNIKEIIERDISYYQCMIEDWFEFKKTGEGSFVEWCESKGKNYEWVKAFYYKR